MRSFAFSVRLFCVAFVIGSVVDAPRVQAADPIEPTGPVKLVQGGFAFTEGPAWDHESGVLYFSDIPNNSIHRLADDGKIEVFTDQSNHSNGLVVAADGRLLACQMDGQVVAYYPATSKVTVLAKQFNGKRFNAPNDLVVDAEGGIYFTDPLFRAPTPLPQDVQAVYYIAKGGIVSRVTEGLAAPNGIGLSPDGKSLYVIPSQQAEMLVYNVDGPGKLSNGRTFCRLAQPEGMDASGGDGMAMDVEGNLYITSNLGIQIFDPQGEPRGLVKFPEQPANVTFGGAGRKTMYVTARTGLYSVEMPQAGLPSN